MNSNLTGTIVFGVILGMATYGVMDVFGVKGVLAGIVIGAYVALAYPWMIKDDKPDGAAS